ncbi:MAG: DUF4403 family protein [Xanthobacteraceae bacterium]
MQPLTGNSVVLAPAAIALSAISEALDAQAPRDLSGKPQNPVSKLLSNAQLTFTVNRGPFAVSGQPGALTVNTPLSGQFEAIRTLTGSVGTGVTAAGDAIGNLIGGNQGGRSTHRYSWQRDDDGAADHRAELATRAQSRRASQ